MQKTSLKTILHLNILFFSLIIAVHLARLLTGWEVTINAWQVPLWINILAIIILGFLTFANARHLR
ncbi:hypothetical protein HYV84_05970 [Candidatus Woesearchaeota archaeon]|nr:hypothetical protein [Candidatus Woesearchaeota archaeon]